jgi:hypothetical protein
MKVMYKTVPLPIIELVKALTSSYLTTKAPLKVIMIPKECWRTLGVAKFTDSGKALKEWCLSMDDQYGLQEAEGEARSDTSFASEALNEESPTDNTKMVT